MTHSANPTTLSSPSQTSFPVVTAVIYQFINFPHHTDYRQPIIDQCNALGLKGTLHLANEGINGTLAGTPAAIEQGIAYLKTIPGFESLSPRIYPVLDAQSETDLPFQRLKIKLKKEIVTFHIPDANPNNAVGTYVKPEDWNNLIQDPDVIVIDTRNDYEYEIGTFKGAVNPNTDSFVDFPNYVKEQLDPQQHKNVAMFCTGGIRCEKATSYLLQESFENVYHLEGGILNYLANMPEEKSLWEGQCFVFDERVALKNGLRPGHYTLCSECGRPTPKPSEAAEASTPARCNQCPES